MNLGDVIYERCSLVPEVLVELAEDRYRLGVFEFHFGAMVINFIRLRHDHLLGHMPLV